MVPRVPRAHRRGFPARDGGVGGVVRRRVGRARGQELVRYREHDRVTTSTVTTPIQGRAVVLDGVSIGGGVSHAVQLVSLISALRYYVERGVNAVVLLPEDALLSSGRDLKTLNLLAAHGKVVRTPGGASHYPFLLRAAQLRGADLVSNHGFDFLLAAQRRVEDRAYAAQYLRSHLVPFRFVLGSFVPQPDARAIAFGLHGPRVPPGARGAQLGVRK